LGLVAVCVCVNTEWWRKDLLELKEGFIYELFQWAESITGCRVESMKVRGAWSSVQRVPRCLQISECGVPARAAVEDHWSQ
jgi:hypothetical protein